MGLLKKSKEDAAVKAAQRALDEGRRFFILSAGSSFGGQIAGVAEQLEAVEDLGWRLEHVSHVWSSSMANHAVGFYVFRRTVA
jgi:hypothetical protein